ncbi:MAG: hypothetical protein QM775_16105 [Pirellulales bacterium]
MRLYDHGHSVVKISQRRIGFRRQYRASRQVILGLLPRHGLPVLIQSREREQGLVAKREVIRFAFPTFMFPFEKSIGRDQAPTAAKRLSKSRLLGGCLAPSVDGREPPTELFDHAGSRPHENSRQLRTTQPVSSIEAVTTPTFCDGAIL